MVAYGESYCTLEQFKMRSGAGVLDSVQDAALQDALDEATDQVNAWTGRNFWLSAADATKDVTSVLGVLDLGDVVSIVSISPYVSNGLYGDPFDVSAYRLIPRDGAPLRVPYRLVELFAGWPSASYRVVGEFGWPRIPGPIVSATFLLANRNRANWTAPFGVTGNAEVGELESSNTITPQIKSLLAPFRVKTV